MKIVIAPDSFKESLSAYETACAIERGFRSILPNAEYIKLPMADGGEGPFNRWLMRLADTLFIKWSRARLVSQ